VLSQGSIISRLALAESRYIGRYHMIKTQNCRTAFQSNDEAWEIAVISVIRFKIHTGPEIREVHGITHSGNESNNVDKQGRGKEEN
jgi:hypothetical protein